MIASILILVISAALLAYWFRYSCAFLLRSRAEESTSVRTIGDESFSYANIQQRLTTEEALDPINRALRRDYDVLVYLVRHSSGMGLDSLEDKLLVWDYKMMQLWYFVTRALFPSQARQAVAEMASIVHALAWSLEKRTEAGTRV